MEELYLIVAELIVHRLDLRVDRLAVHGIEADNVRDALPTDKLPASRRMIVLPPNRASPYSEQF
jgi:hypothetical protein